MAGVKIKMTRDTFVAGDLFANKKSYTVDEKTAVYLMRRGKAVPADDQTKAGGKAEK